MTDDSPKRPPAGADRTDQLVESVLRDLWALVNKVSRVRPTEPARYRVTIFGSARVEPGAPLYEDVRRLTKALAELGCDIVSGGGPGLMQAANEGAQQGDPEDRQDSIGVTIALPFEKGANPFVEQLYTHESFFTRLHQFARLSQAYVVFGGGIGTTLEMLLIWQLLQVGHVPEAPLILVGDMWADLVDWCRAHMLGATPKLAHAEDLAIPRCVATPEQALALLRPHITEFYEGAMGRQRTP